MIGDLRPNRPLTFCPRLCYNAAMPARLRALYHRPWVQNAAAVLLLTALALAACGFLLRDDLFIYGDHPGQFLRLWYPLRASHRLLGWNPLWYAGYPELQFYPPGFVMWGWLLDILTLGRLSPLALYQLLLFTAYLLPALSIYALTGHVTQRRWMGLVCGALGLVFPELWGGTTAVFVGLVAERLAFGLVPLVILAGWRALHTRPATGWWLATGFALAVTFLMHPFHAVAPVLFLGLAALSHTRRWVHLRALALTVIFSLALVSFWLLPLVVRSGYTAPMLRANLTQTVGWLLGPNLWPYIAASLLVPLAVLVQSERRFTVFVAATLGTAAILCILIVLDHTILIEKLGILLLDPVRFSAEVYLMLVLLAGLGLSYLPPWLRRTRWPTGGRVAGGLVLALTLAWLTLPFLGLLQEHRTPARFLKQARQTYGLDDTWKALQAGTGRVLFTSSYLSLDDMPTALKAATPFFSERAMVGGTFSHWSPVARLLWMGRVDVDLLPGQVELSDDKSLAGRSWAEWTDAEFLELCHRLNVTTVAATWDDINARTFLDAAPHFQSFYSDQVFVLYHVLDPIPALVEAENATVTLLRAEATALDLSVDDATAGAILQVKITDYPLWQVQAQGQTLVHNADQLGLMSVRLPAGSYDVSLRYWPGLAERVGGWISLGAVILGLAILALGAWSHSGRRSKGRPVTTEGSNGIQKPV